MYTIQNDVLTVVINPKGAELSSINHKKNGLEYLWSGDPAFWAKRSPVLFPIVGTLKENGYLYKGRQYNMGRHGFARDQEFSASNHSLMSVSFTLESSAQTLEKFPFPFEFTITYSVEGSRLSVAYQVENTGEDDMFFSVGGHPAFRVPLAEGTAYEDYYLQFDAPESAGRWPISKDGLIEAAPLPLLENSNQLPLKRELFYKDALVFKRLSSSRVSLKSNRTDRGLDFDFTGFPYLGIWAAKDADFVCIEPWCGIADSVGSTRQLTEKEGIVRLPSGKQFERTWRVTLY